MARFEAMKQVFMARARIALGKATTADIKIFMDYVDAMEGLLDEGDQMDKFGTEGWLHRIGYDN